MSDYIIIHKYIEERPRGINNYCVNILGKCMSTTAAILRYVEDECGGETFKTFSSISSRLTNNEMIKLYNLMLKDEDEIVGVYEIAKEVYMKKNAFYLEEE